MITFLETFQKELEAESVGTRKMLALVPADKMDWAPHPKSMKMKMLATHIAELPGWISLGLTTDELDFNASPYNPEDCKNSQEMVALYDRCKKKAMEDLANAKEEVLEGKWTLRAGETIYAVNTKQETVRHAFSQITHHRAQLGVYLRLLNIPIPGVYGPSADEQQP
ncbi:MAG: DinB family protein [Bacteroidetes bacterium]|nr:DinB family protein [Bacteroidota bacterium]